MSQPPTVAPENLRRAAETAIRTCLGTEPGESLLVVTDGPCLEIGRVMWETARDLGAEALLMEMLPRRNHGQEPPPAVAQAMAAADVCLCPTSTSLSHTRARRKASEQGTRIATLPEITPETMCRALTADYEQIGAVSRELARALSGIDVVRLTTPLGTDLTFHTGGRDFRFDTGMYTERGAFGNLPAGEVYIAPLEGTARGVCVIDATFSGVGPVQGPLRLEIEDGFATSIQGPDAARIEELLEPFGREGRNLAELGIGTNPCARICGNMLEDEKVAGTIHIALGASAAIGGKVQVGVHLDALMTRPTLTADDRVLIRDGGIVIQTP